MSVEDTPGLETAETLGSWIREHHVTWEVSPWQEIVDHSPMAVGFEVRLYARHAPGRFPDPGCHLCGALHEKLRAIALSVLPKEHRPTQYTIEPLAPQIHLRPEGHWDPEVELVMHIVHRDGYLRGIDDCEKRCAGEIQDGLRGLGVQPKSWHDSRPA